MASRGSLVLMAVSCVMMAVVTAGQQEGVEVEVLLGHLVEERLSGCHLVLITTTHYSPVFSKILRRMSDGVQAGVVLETGLLSHNHEPATQKDSTQEHPGEGNRQIHDQSAEDQLLQGLWGDSRTICRAVILDLTVTNHTHRTLSLLEASGLWTRPETYVLVVGWKANVEAILLYPCFRNTLYGLYLALDHLTDLHTSGLQGSNNPRLRKNVVQGGVESEGLQVFRRCEYCHSGEAGVELLSHWNLTSGLPDTRDLFQDQLENFMGHQFHIVGMPFFPYLDYQRDTQEPGTTVTPNDSLAVRVLNTLASALNFTYEISEQRDRAWGLQQPNGSFNGVVGDLESEVADFCILMAPTPARIQAMEFSGAYPSDVLSVTSLKPTLLPQHLALIRPFAGELWVILLVSVVLWGATLWLLHGALAQVGGRARSGHHPSRPVWVGRPARDSASSTRPQDLR
ncbi:glutamate receptor ionotropic, kainate 1-like isoform X2 [Panulirus ornatus]|uniref:glutamate receptor ionotropic, kainate 1-like isoform X2 n=1 Tax=Panulirus ornatus TaxID=150431 RepID=UPI003A8AB8A7